MKQDNNKNELWNYIYAIDKNPVWSRRGEDPELKKMVIDALSKSANKKWNILDIGCGNGRNCTIFDQIDGYEFQYTGIDFSTEAIKYCIESYSNKQFFTVDISKDITSYLQIPDSGFNMIIDHGCLHALNPDFRDQYRKNIYTLASANCNYIIGAWNAEGTDKNKSTNKNPDFLPYDILPEWFISIKDIEKLFKKYFFIDNYFIDKTEPNDIHNGMLYCLLKRSK